MSNTILIPTDFSVKSLNLAKTVVKYSGITPVKLILAHGLLKPDSITELLFYNEKELINSLLSQDFIAACKFIKNTYASTLKSLKIELIPWNSQAAFNNYCEARSICKSFMYDSYIYKYPHSRSFDLSELILNSPTPLENLEWDNSTDMIITENQLSELFFIP